MNPVIQLLVAVAAREIGSGVLGCASCGAPIEAGISELVQHYLQAHPGRSSAVILGLVGIVFWGAGRSALRS